MNIRAFRRLAAVVLATAALLSVATPQAQAQAKVKAAFVMLETVDDQGWTAAHAQGVEYLKKTMGDKVEVAYTEAIVSPADSERVIRDYAAKGYDIVFGTTFGYMDPMLKVAAEFPKQAFEHCSGYKTGPNMGNYFGRMYQGEYLAGYMAGLMGFKNVGAVATQPIPEPIRGVNAFTIGLKKGLDEIGAKYDADKLVTVVWLKSWRDPINETTLAETLAAKGHDLIRQMADTPDSAKAACAAGVPAIGYGGDAAAYGADCALVSSMWNWGPFYVSAVKEVMDGTWKADEYWKGFEADGVALSAFNKSVPAEVQKKVLAEKAKLEKGEDNVFMGPLIDQNGKQIVPAGQKVSDKSLLTERWFVKGVSGAIPE